MNRTAVDGDTAQGRSVVDSIVGKTVRTDSGSAHAHHIAHMQVIGRINRIRQCRCNESAGDAAVYGGNCQAGILGHLNSRLMKAADHFIVSRQLQGDICAAFESQR